MIPCFMVERVNERTVHKDCEDHPEGHDEEVFDVARVDDGQVLAKAVFFFSGAMPPGAMWWQDITESNRPAGPGDWPASWDKPKPDAQRGPSHTFGDGLHLCVRTPGGVWNIDSRASNCTMPFDYEHRCWIRHGDPPAITVDKQGTTCDAGAGSIQAGSYHGFLTNGALTD